jgi:hypothetical protein
LEYISQEEGRQVKPVYFIFFPLDSPVLELLPASYRKEGAFDDIQDAIDYFMQHNQDPARHEADQKRADQEAVDPGEADLGETGSEDKAGAAEKRIALVNCLDYYRRVPLLQKEPDGILLQQITSLKEACGGLGIRLLMPEGKNIEQNLLIDMMSRGFYDFWFLSALNRNLLQAVLETRRSFREMEAYLGTLPPPAIPKEGAARENRIARMLKGSAHIGIPLEKWLISGLNQRKGKGKHFTIREKGIFDEETGIPVISGAPAGECENQHDSGDADAPGRDDFAVDYGSLAMPADSSGGSDYLAEDTAQGMSIPLERVSKKNGRAQTRNYKEALGSLLNRKTPPAAWQTSALPPSATALFYSEEDGLLPYALAFLASCYLASSGGKTLLVELPGSGSRLAETLGIRHPGKNLNCAMQNFVSDSAGQWENYCFNGAALYGDPGAIDRTGFCKRLPKQLYFLPEGYSEEESNPYWDSFFSALLHWAIIDEQFSYIFYVGFGNLKNACWKKSLTSGYKIIAYPPWPCGFNNVPDMANRWRKGCIPAFDGSWGMKYIHDEIKAMKLGEYLIVPGAVKEDFIQMASFERENSDLSPDSLACLNTLCSRLIKGRKQDI